MSVYRADIVRSICLMVFVLPAVVAMGPVWDLLNGKMYVTAIICPYFWDKNSGYKTSTPSFY